MKEIAHIVTDFPEKFGIPRQSGIVDGTRGKIIFEPEYRTYDAFKGLEDYSYIWIIWKFSESNKQNWSATVKPPRLGGNKRMGVFATRSPFRPNPVGLSSVKLEKIEQDEKLGTVLHVSGMDLMNGTPIYDIKPYLAYTDSHTDARCGFADDVKDYELEVDFPKELLEQIPERDRNIVLKLLKQDPRPSYIKDGSRIFGMAYGGYNIRFQVVKNCLKVVQVRKNVTVHTSACQRCKT